jgi:hypothetical protein
MYLTSILSLSTIFRLEFETVPTLVILYFCILFYYSRINLRLLFFNLRLLFFTLRLIFFNLRLLFFNLRLLLFFLSMLTYKFNNSIKCQTILNDDCRRDVYSGMFKFVVHHQDISNCSIF